MPIDCKTTVSRTFTGPESKLLCDKRPSKKASPPLKQKNARGNSFPFNDHPEKNRRPSTNVPTLLKKKRPLRENMFSKSLRNDTTFCESDSHDGEGGVVYTIDERVGLPPADTFPGRRLYTSDDYRTGEPRVR